MNSIKIVIVAVIIIFTFTGCKLPSNKDENVNKLSTTSVISSNKRTLPTGTSNINMPSSSNQYGNTQTNAPNTPNPTTAPTKVPTNAPVKTQAPVITQTPVKTQTPVQTETPQPGRVIVDFPDHPGYKMYKDGVIDSSTNIQMYNDKIMEDEIIRLVNLERQSKGLNALVSDERLRVTARYKSTDMYTNNYFKHDAPDGTGFDDIYTKFGYPAIRAGGENIAYSIWSNCYIVTAQGIFNSWKNSPGHYANMISSNYTNIGIGITLDNKDGMVKCYSTQHFAATF